ncbi:MAG: hypothetical protein HY700_06335 [Gemmatimonadetes bacterium]|nr:hypothetical protein [Gemmatimonadota bacterium]
MGKYQYLAMLVGYAIVLDLIGFVLWWRDRKHRDEPDPGDGRHNSSTGGVPA